MTMGQLPCSCAKHVSDDRAEATVAFGISALPGTLTVCVLCAGEDSAWSMRMHPPTDADLRSLLDRVQLPGDIPIPCTPVLLVH